MNGEAKKIRALVYLLIEGLERGELKLIESVYAHGDDLLVFLEGPAMKLAGWNAMRRAVAQFLRDHTGIRSRLNKDSRFIASGKLGVFYGTYRFRAVHRRTGKIIRWTARNTFVFGKTSKGWRVIHEHDSFPAPPPGN